ncbi:MAG: PRC-barrel domain-containing protein [Anaerolineae bacterium]|jgi:sporulation protein YlmC with PRC-barrel domain
MRLGKSLIGNPVFDITDGRKLGEVKDLYVDDDLTAVVGLFLGREGLLRPTPHFVERADIALFGIEVILAKAGATVYEGAEATEPPGWLRLEALRGREVKTPGGTRIGKVGDVALDEEARITGFSLTNLAVKGPVAEAAAVARKAVVEVASTDNIMTLDLAQAEQAPLAVDPDLLFSKAIETPLEAPYEAPAEEIEIPQESAPLDQEEAERSESA